MDPMIELMRCVVDAARERNQYADVQRTKINSLKEKLHKTQIELAKQSAIVKEYTTQKTLRKRNLTEANRIQLATLEKRKSAEDKLIVNISKRCKGLSTKDALASFVRIRRNYAGQIQFIGVDRQYLTMPLSRLRYPARLGIFVTAI